MAFSRFIEQITRAFARDTVIGEDAAEKFPEGASAEATKSRKSQSMLAPTDLELSDIGPKNVLLIGACFFMEWADMLKNLGYDDLNIDALFFTYATRLPKRPPKRLEHYDLQLIQVPLPTIMPESEYMRLDARDPMQYEDLLQRSVQKLDLFLKEALVWSDRVPAFVMTYLSPQQCMLGRFFPRYDIRNPIHFVERLNMELDAILKNYSGAYLFDTNQIASVYGRRFFQEDAFWWQHHGGIMNTSGDAYFDDGKRIEQSASVIAVHSPEVDKFVEMVWLEVRAAYRTLKRADEVKMLCIDLDDTLWRGVIGEIDSEITIQNQFAMVAGWPNGLVEVLQFLRRRGIILAVISKNDEAHVRAIFPKIFYSGWIELDDFAIIKINRRPKAENIAEAMAEANILPKSVVFLDDNPVERAAVKAAFPEIRVIETSHYRWGRVLAWSPELQVPTITEESSRRTEMIQAQVERNKARAALSREEFLASLNLRTAVHPLVAVTDNRFARAFELINKTNQYNTTGVRWSESDARAYFDTGGVWWTFEVADSRINYELVGVVCIRDNHIGQFVMSCRVAGLDVELAALWKILGKNAKSEFIFTGTITPTGNNSAARDIFERLGWVQQEDRWYGTVPETTPAHIAVLETV